MTDKEKLIALFDEFGLKHQGEEDWPSKGKSTVWIMSGRPCCITVEFYFSDKGKYLGWDAQD